MKKTAERKLTLTMAKREILRLTADRLVARQQASEAQEKAEQAWGHSALIYEERDLLVYGLSTVWPSHLMPHQNSRTARWIVCIHSPQGQLAWHISDAELTRYAHLRRLPNHWDGCKTVDKHARLAQLKPMWAESEIPTLEELATKRLQTIDPMKTSEAFGAAFEALGRAD